MCSIPDFFICFYRICFLGELLVRSVSAVVLKHADFFHHLAIELCFLFQCQWIGSAAAGHAVEANGASLVRKLSVRSNFWLFHVKLCQQGVGGFLSGGDDGLALWHRIEYGGYVGGLHHFQEFVGSIALQPAYGRGGVVESNAVLGAKLFDLGLAELACRSVDKVVAVAMKEQAHDAPHVVLQVGVKEVHAPSLLLWRKAAKHQQPRCFGQEWLQRMLFDIESGGWLIVHGGEECGRVFTASCIASFG